MDTLSGNVSVSSLRVVGATANMKMSTLKVSGMNIVRFDFPNINLLDSSHHNQCDGTVIFNINVKSGLAPGTTIDNHAGIFFDDNPVVMTNYVENVIGDPTLFIANITGKVAIFPNPATDELTIKTDYGAYSSYSISNNIGQVLINGQVSAAQTKVDVKTLPAGVYYVTLKGANNKVVKFVKM